MKDKQNSNIETQETDEEDNLEFFYNKIKNDYEQQGGNKPLIITASILGGLALIGYIIYKIIKKKPLEMKEIALLEMEKNAHLKSLENNGINVEFKHGIVLENTLLPKLECENECTKTYTEKFEEMKIDIAMEKAQKEEDKRLDQEKEMKLKQEREKYIKTKSLEQEFLKGGNPNKQHIDKLLKDIYDKCNTTSKWNKENWNDTGPPINNTIIKDVVHYCLLEGIVTKVIFEDIASKAESGSQKIDKKKILTEIRDNVKKNFKKYLQCDFSQIKGEFRIEKILTEEALCIIILNSLQMIEKEIDSFTVEKIYTQLGITKDTKNVCKTLPVATLFGIPRLTHKTLKGLETALKRKKFKNTSEIIGNAEEQLCVDLLAAVLDDYLTPIKIKMKDQIRKMKEKFDPNNIKKRGGALIGEGVYGCVFRPHLYCNGKESTGKKDHVSKLIIGKKWKIEREFTISNIIRKIPQYEKFFAPLLEICPVDLKKIYTQGKEDCKLLNKKQDSNKVSFLAKMKYIPMVEFNDYITESNNLNNFVNFVSIFSSILNTVEMLIAKKIVHYDLHGGNIIVNKETNQPVVIDFGLSFSIKKFSVRDLQANFGIFNNAPAWSNYPIEVHYLSFIVTNKRHMNIGETNTFIDKYLEKHKIINSFPSIIKNPEKTNFKKKLFLAISSFKRYNLNKCIKIIIKKCWKTWDTHMISYLFLNYFKIFNINNLLLNKFCKKAILLLFNNISPLSEERLSPKKLSEKFTKYINHLSPEILLKIKRNYDENEEFIYSSFKKETIKSFRNRMVIENRY